MRSATEMVASIYAQWIERSRIITTNLWSSELAKLAANAFLAQRLSTVLAPSMLSSSTLSVAIDSFVARQASTALV